jgi:2-keto-4-pentenoate hydratase
VLAATEGVMACFEIVDSRIENWKIKIQDTVADNASCGVFVLGDRLVDPRDVDLTTCGMVLEKNGEIVGTGAGAATMGSPVNAVAWLANTLGRLGIRAQGRRSDPVRRSARWSRSRPATACASPSAASAAARYVSFKRN